MVDKFCYYIDDILSVVGDADAPVEARIRIGLNKFRQLVPLLTNRDVSLIRRRLYISCVRSSMLHGSETWPVRKDKNSSGDEIANVNYILKDQPPCKNSFRSDDVGAWSQQPGNTGFAQYLNAEIPEVGLVIERKTGLLTFVRLRHFVLVA